jgi:hypothetical protein
VTDLAVLPPEPAHVSVYVALPATLGVTVSAPLTGSVPLQEPLAMQDVALVEDQVSVAFCPIAIELWFNASAIVSTGLELIMLLELPPPQAVRINTIGSASAHSSRRFLAADRNTLSRMLESF